MCVPDETTLAETVARMERRLTADRSGADLAAAYATACARFDADLSNPRDVLLSRGGALMVLQALRADRGEI